MNIIKLVSAVMAWGALLSTAGCSDVGSQDREAALKPVVRTPEFSAYWNQGKAEVTRYALQQARYGELRDGDAVLIFVTEDFLGDKQVKLESDPAGKKVVPVLKMNFTKKFATGIYPYSMMSSVFTPVDAGTGPATLKVTTTSQEWCGHTYTQFNFRNTAYDVRSFSYFEKEGDREFSLDPVMLEDEIWNRIRLAPATLPTGAIRMIPGTMSSRLRHIDLAAEDARASLAEIGADSSGRELVRYTIEYPGSQRTLAIEFEKRFPFRIISWSETYRDGFGPKAQMLTTRATCTHELMIDYWAHNSTADDSLRRSLGLP